MTVRFGGHDIPGAHGVVAEGPVELFARRTYFYGLRGVSEIVSGYGGRPLSIDIWIYDEYDELSDLQSFLLTLDKRVGEHGKLETVYSEASGRNQTFDHCTFLGLERLPLGGRSHPGPIKDVAGTVNGGWLVSGRLHFQQLRID